MVGIKRKRKAHKKKSCGERERRSLIIHWSSFPCVVDSDVLAPARKTEREEPNKEIQGFSSLCFYSHVLLKKGDVYRCRWRAGHYCY